MKAFVAILSVAVIALGATAIHLSRQLDASRQRLVDLEAQLPDQSASAPAVAAIATSASLPIAGPTAGVSAAANLDRMGIEESVQASIATRNSPESRAQVKTTMVGMMPNQYPDVGRVLEISRDQVDQLFNVLYEQIHRRNGMDLSDATAMARLDLSDRDEIRSLLGSKYAKWEEYRADLPTRRQVRDLGVVLESTGTPLTGTQIDSLISSVAAAESRNTQDRENWPAEERSSFHRYSQEGNRRILDAAAAHLTPQQLESYGQVLERALIQEVALRHSFNQARDADQSRQVQR